MSEETKAQARSALRSILIALGAFAAGKGWVGQEIVDQLIPAILVLAPLAWGVLDKRQPPAKPE